MKRRHNVTQTLLYTYSVASYSGKVFVLQEPIKLHSKERLSMVFLHATKTSTIEIQLIK